jgi:ribosomal protein S12 methylthiotransferase
LWYDKKVTPKNTNKRTFHIVSLGCDKNAVDADSMAGLLSAAGYTPVESPQKAGVVIVNTCGFIEAASEESYGMLAKMAAKKKSGQILIASGCLTQRYGGEVNNTVPGIDAILGTLCWMDIVKVIESLKGAENTKVPGVLPDTGQNESSVPRVSIQGASAYIKIAEGCSRACAFCAIPLIKGPAVSRPMEAIIAEVAALQAKHIREIILIAQNTTDYGHDLGLKNGLAQLLKTMTAASPNIDWIRIMYAYPGFVTDELIEVMAANRQIVPSLDMPLQHAHAAVLKRMGRPANIDWVYKTLEKMRKAIPGLALRSTFIVGYPEETEAEFQTLLDFIKDIRFDKLGTMKYSFEPGTPAEALGDTIPDEVKEDRLRRLMEKQQEISLKLNQAFIGRKLDVLIEGAGEDISIGRSYRDAPKVDGLVLVKGEIAAGEMVKVTINKAMEYDLGGVPAI